MLHDQSGTRPRRASPASYGRRGPGSAVAVAIGLGVLAFTSCASAGPSRPQIQVTVSDAAVEPAAGRATDLHSALRALDTLFVPAYAPSPTELGLLETIRLVRRGELSRAARRLQAVVPGDTATAVAQQIRGQLLLHEGLWADLAQLAPATGEPGGIARTFLDGGPEEIEFGVDEVVLPLEQSAVGTPVLVVAVGSTTRRFWVDTGAGLTVLSATLATELGLLDGAVAGMEAGTATSRSVPARPVVIPELGLGDGVRVRRHPAIVLQDEDLSFDLPGGRLDIDGIIGWNLIRHLDLTLDVARGRAVLRRPRPETRGPRNLLWFGYPMVVAHAEMGGELLFGLDTGAAASSLSHRFLELVDVGPVRTRTRRVGGAGGFEEVEVQVVPAATMLVAGHRVRFVRIDAAPLSLPALADLHGVIGSDLVAHVTIRIDWLNGRFELDPGTS